MSEFVIWSFEEIAEESERLADLIEAENPAYAKVLREDAMRCRSDDIFEDPIEERREALAKRRKVPIEEVTDEVLEEYESQFR